MDLDHVHAINETAASLHASVSELDVAGLTTVDSNIVSVPGVKEAKIRMECKLVEMLSLPKDNPGCELFIGEIVQYHIDDQIFEDGKINPLALKAVSRLAGASYAGIGNIFDLEHKKERGIWI